MKRINEAGEWIEKVKKSKAGPIIRWVIIALGAAFLILGFFADRLFGKENVLTESVGEILDFVAGFEKNLPVILKTLTWIFLIIVISRVLRSFIKLVSKKVQKSKSVINLVDSIIKYAFAIVLVFKVLNLWGVDATTLLASAGILGLVVGLGAQKLIADIISGLFIIFERPFLPGDIIQIEGFIGTVQEIGVRNTKVLDGGGNVKIISNSDVRNVVNMTDEPSWAVCDVTIDYGEPLEKVEKIFTSNLENFKAAIPAIIGTPLYAGVGELGQNGYAVKIMVQCREEDRYQTARDLNRQIKLLCEKKGIKISLPQIVVNKTAPNKKGKN